MLLLAPFASQFSHQTWRHVPVLVMGALLAPGRRVVSSALLTIVLAFFPRRRSARQGGESREAIPSQLFLEDRLPCAARCAA